jgi:EmrB/QacA subfamily drug resistance transporter
MDGSAATAEQATPVTEGLRPDWRAWVAIGGVTLGLFMGALENTVAGTAMPTIVASLGGIEHYSWVFAAYMLAATVMIPLWGKMADLVGRRPALFGGLAFFMLGSALCGAAHSMPQLIAFRVVQGLGAGALFPVGMIIAADLFTLRQRTKVIAMFSAMWGVASLVGPLAGGYLTEQISWRWVFYINLPFGLMAALLVWLTYRERTQRRGTITLDYAGMVTLSLGVTLLLLVVQRAAAADLLMTVAGSAAALGLLVAFVFCEKRSPEPLIPLVLFQQRLVGVATLQGLLTGMAVFGALSFAPLFAQSVLGASPTQAGVVLTPFILAWVVTGPVGGRLLLRHGYRWVTAVGMVPLVAGSVLLTQVSAHTTRGQLMVAVILMGVGGGLTAPVQTIAVQHAVATHLTGVATSAIVFARTIGGALGTSIMGALMTWRLRGLLAAVPGQQSGSRPVTDVAQLLHPSSVQLPPQVAIHLHQAMANSLRLAFTFLLVAALAAAVLTYFAPRENSAVHQ